MEELSDGAIVWVKLSNCWWPGEVIGDEKLSDDFLSSLRKKPLAVVKFFDEDAYEYVKNPNFIFKYNCPRKTEFLRKGLEQYRAKNKHMEKFPADVMHAERMTGGDPNIVNSTDFLPQKKERYSGLFQDSAKGKDKKNKSLTPSKAMAISVVSDVGRKTMHEIRILAQPSAASKPATSGSDGAVEKLISPSSQTYHCHKCGFSSSRQNVIVIHTKNCRATGAAVVSTPSSTTSGAKDKGKTDAKLKKELLADWSEDEQDDDMDTTVGETKNTQDNSEEKKIVAKESSSSMSPQKDADNGEESAKMKQRDEKESNSDALEVAQSKANTFGSGPDTKMLPSDEESSTAKDSDKEITSDSPLTTSSVSSTTTAPPLVSPCTTIKYRNIPKKQKREFIEVTNDDASSVHGPVHDKAPSREDSTASSSSTTGSSDTLGNGITTLFMGTGATDRPISAKQLILNRATRCSSKSLSGDETLKADDGKLDSDKNDRCESQQNREAIKQTESIANEQVSCFDFKDDDEHEKSPQSSQFSSAAHRRSGSLADRKSAAKEAPQEDFTVSQKRRSSGRKKSVTEGALASTEKEQQNSNEATVAINVRTNWKENSDSGADRDAQLSEAIDFLLEETDVPKLPDDLKQVVAAVSEKIDCNRTLPPKERGKRIFKTRNKSSLAATTDTKDSAEESGVAKSVEVESNKNQGNEQQEKMDHERSPDEAIPKTVDVSVDSESTVAHSVVDKKARASGTKFENSDFAAFKAKRTKYSREEDYQNPSVTSSEQGTEAVEEPAPALLEHDEKPSVINPKSEIQQTPPIPGSSPNAKGRRGKQKKPTPITTPLPVVAMVESVEVKATTDLAVEGNETAKMDVENEASTKEVETNQEENVAKKLQRKSSDNLLPDSSGNEPSQSRRRTKIKHQRDVEVRVPPIEAESSRRSKRYRKETASDSSHTRKSRVPSNIEECVVGNAIVAKETENTTTAVVADVRQAEDESMKQPESSSVSVDDEVLVEKDVKANNKQEKPSLDSGKSLKRKQDARATAEFTGKMEQSLASDGKAQEYAKPTDEGALRAELGKDRKLKPNRHTIGSSGAVVSSSPVVMGTKPTPTDLQVAEALIHLPEAAAAAAAAATATLAVLPVVSKVKEPETELGTEKLSPSLTQEDDDLTVSSSPSVTQSLPPSAVVIGAAQSSSRSGAGSIAMRSINPRKRHLQSMLLTEDAAGEQKRAATCHKTAHVESTSVTNEPVSSPVVSGGTEEQKQQQQQKKNTPILEKKKKESAGESEPLPFAVPVDEDKFDIDSMPIVMGDNGLLVDNVVVNEHTPGSTPKTTIATSTRVIKNVNGSGMSTVDKHQEPSVSSGPVVTTMKGGVAAKEQIVITSKGTVLTTSSSAVAVKSKLQPASKSDVKVTSAITLGTTGVRVSATASALSATTSRRTQAEQTAPSSSSNGSHKVPVADEEQLAKEKSAIALAAVPSFSVASSVAPKKMITKKLLGDSSGTLAPASSSIVIATNVADRRYSGDEPSSSVSSSSSTVDSSKKGHRVMKITPQKLQQFSRLGYVEDKGKRKVMTASGMRQFKREQLLQQQQQQHKLQPTPNNALPTQSKPASTADAKKKSKHTTTKTIGSSTGMVLASSSSSRSAVFGLAEAVSSGNVVVAAAADSSVQELQGGTTVSLAKQLVVTDADGERNAMIIETILPAATIKSTVVAPEKVIGTVPFESSDGAQLLEGSPSSSTSAASEVILGGAVDSAIPSIGVVEPSSSSSTAASTAAGEQESQYIAVNAEHFGGPPNLFYLCSVRDEGLVPVNNQLLYLDASNQLVALAAGQQHSGSGPTAEDIINQAEVIIPTGSNGADLSGPTVALASATGETGAAAVNVVAAGGSDVGAVVETGSSDGTQQSFLLNTQDGQQIILDQQSLMALAASGDTPHLLTADGQQILLQEATQEWLTAFAVGQQHQPQSAGSTLSALVTPEGTQIILAPDCIELQEPTALLPTEVIQVHPSTTIETNAILTKPPIMSTVEVPSKNSIDPSVSGSTGADQRLGRKSAPSSVPGAAGHRAAASGTVGKQSPPGASILVATAGTSATTNLDETTLAAVIGVPCKPTNVPTSLELPITVTNPAIAKTTTTSSRLNPVLFPVGGSATATVPSDLALPPATTVVLLAGPMAAAAAGTAADRAPTLSSPAASSPMHPDPTGESITVGAILPQCGAMTQEEINRDKTETVENLDSDDDIQIPNTPDSQLDSGRQIAYDSSDSRDYDDDEVPANTPNDDSGQRRRNHYEARRIPGDGNVLMMVDVDDDDDEGSNGSEIIPLQPNVVVLDGSLLNQNLGDEVDDGDDDDGIEDDTDGDGDLEDLPHQPTVRTVHCVPTSGRNGAHGASNNDSGIDTTMAGTAVAASASANNAAPHNGARRTVVER
ncbi:uncharacterized protein LOC131212583 [Anopheles bellator]|uniref:uncharacterized protein LOC131212583 n=1 Tax=Anopheles bellator TaxID=139047 RepID=UPI00264A1A96|nr:uncharacterized protein LOC131212583 [Anopheles bellator]